ncbi:MAG TPA: aminomethyltransferase family protein [Actinomycetes bacterium]|nr:aminomethyltransferase family protein [Actinomycetes bacterium]
MAESGSIRSVLYEVQRRQGGTFDDFDGWTWTLDLGDTLGEYEAMRSGAAMWDVYALAKWEVTGPDARTAIQRLFTNDLSTQSVGQVKYGAFVDENGAMVDDGTVYRLADDRYFVFTNRHELETELATHSPDASVRGVDRTHDMPLVSVQGPRSREILQTLTTTDLGGLAYFRFLPHRVDVAGVPVWVSRTGFSGELGFELIPDRGDAEPLWTTLAAAGVRPIGFNAVEIARIEVGLVVHDFDYSVGQRTPFDIGLDRVVALSSGADYVGKDALADIAEHPPNRFRTLRIDGAAAPEYGSDVRQDGSVVGTLTSPTISPRYGTIGLAVLRADVAERGNEVTVTVGDEQLRAVVEPLSIHDPDKRRPRA